MFDKKLFVPLCEKYDVEFSKTATKPMMQENNTTHAISKDDVWRIFSFNENNTAREKEKEKFLFEGFPFSKNVL